MGGTFSLQVIKRKSEVGPGGWVWPKSNSHHALISRVFHCIGSTSLLLAPELASTASSTSEGGRGRGLNELVSS